MANTSAKSHGDDLSKLKTMELSGEKETLQTKDLDGLSLSWAFFHANKAFEKKFKLNASSAPQPYVVFDPNRDRFFSMIHGNYIDPLKDSQLLLSVIQARDITFAKRSVDDVTGYVASVNDGKTPDSKEYFAESREVAIYRCFVGNEIGETVDVPVEVVRAQEAALKAAKSKPKLKM